MSLKVVMKSGEQLHVGTSRIIVASDQYVTFIIDGDGPVLRDGDFLQPAAATTKARQVYLTLQTIYLTGRPDDLIEQYSAHASALLAEAPEAADLLSEINAALESGHAYRALKTARRLVQREQETMSGADGTWHGFE